MNFVFKQDKNSKCPHESGDIVGQIEMELAIEEWNRKNRTEYDSMVAYFKEVKGYKKERKMITHEDIGFVTTEHLCKGCTGTIITIALSKEYEFGIYLGYDLEKISHSGAYGVRINATDALNNELEGTARVEIRLRNTGRGFYRSCLPPPYYIHYENLCRTDELFKFNNHFVIDKHTQQEYIIINSNIDIKNIEYLGTWDFWR